jgi:hypothetical protein
MVRACCCSIRSHRRPGSRSSREECETAIVLTYPWHRRDAAALVNRGSSVNLAEHGLTAVRATALPPHRQTMLSISILLLETVGSEQIAASVTVTFAIS